MGGKNRTLLGRKDRGLLPVPVPVPVLVMCLMFCSIPVLFAQAPGVTQSAEAPASSPTDLSRNGAIWRHPVGFSFWYPSTFKAVDADGGVQLVPSGVAQSSAATAVAATELYYLTAESIQGSGITSPFDPRVIQYLDSLVASNVSPYLQRKAEPSKVPMGGGEGMSAEWTAAGQGGQTIVARIYTTIMQQFGVFHAPAAQRGYLQFHDRRSAPRRHGVGRADQSLTQSRRHRASRFPVAQHRTRRRLGRSIDCLARFRRAEKREDRTLERRFRHPLHHVAERWHGPMAVRSFRGRPPSFRLGAGAVLAEVRPVQAAPAVCRIA